MKKRGAIDSGNTRIKAGVFDETGQLIAVEFFTDIQGSVRWLEGQDVSKLMIADVKGNLQIRTDKAEIKYIDGNLKLPFRNLYETPETLGADRIAAMAAIASIYPFQASLVFDIGTCMTIDFLNPEMEYSGGNISPGIQMRLKAMQHFTDRLPLSSIDNNDYSMGHDSLSALANGAVCGVLYEIEGYIGRIMERYPDVNIILCGGDAHYFEKQLKYRIFANKNLVLLGLYHLSVFND